MNIVYFEIKRSLPSTLIWTVAIVIIGLLYTAMGPIFIDSSADMRTFLSEMGQPFLDGLGIDIDTFFSPVGYFSYIGGFIGLALGIQALIYGINSFVLEKNKQVVEFLYTKPVSRTKLFCAKYFANWILLTLTQIVVISAIYIATDKVNSVSYDNGLMLLLLLSFIPLQYLFYTLGAVIGVVVNKQKNVVAISIGIALGMFFLNMLNAILGDHVFDLLTFFNYYNMSDIVANQHYDILLVLISAGLIGIFGILSLLIFRTKDIKVK